MFGTMPKAIEEQEHSIEMQYPFIAKALPNVKVVPIMVGHLNKTQSPNAYAKLIAPLLVDDTVLVVSSDFCHWGEDFDYTPTKKGVPISTFIKQLDHEAMHLIEEGKC